MLAERIDWSARDGGVAYNLTVADRHTYFVAVGPSPMLVRNDCFTRYEIDHFRDHGVGASAVSEYIAKAQALFYRQGEPSIFTKIDPMDGTIRVFDSATGHFGSYPPDGDFTTYILPDSPWDYQRAQPGIIE